MSLRQTVDRPIEAILGQFLEGLNQAAGGASHMFHHHQDTRWFKIRAIIEASHKMCVQVAVDPMLKINPEKPRLADLV